MLFILVQLIGNNKYAMCYYLLAFLFINPTLFFPFSNTFLLYGFWGNFFIFLYIF